MEKKLKRRRIYRLLLQPRFQLKYGAYFMTIAVSSLVCSSIITLYITMKLLTFTQTLPDSEDIFKVFVLFIKHNPFSVAGTFGVMAFFYYLLAVVFTKRIVGPVTVLVKHIEALKAGNYDHKTTLRKDDDLVSLMDALNSLSDVLKEKNHQSSNRKESEIRIAS